MDKINEIGLRARGFASKHKTKIAVGATALAGVMLMRNQSRVFEGFLEHKEIPMEEFATWLAQGD